MTTSTRCCVWAASVAGAMVLAGMSARGQDAPSACDALGSPQGDGPEALTLLERAEREARAEHDPACLALVGQHRATLGDCARGGMLTREAAREGAGLPLVQCSDALVRACNIAREAASRGRGEPVDCVTYGAPRATVELATACLAPAMREHLAAARMAFSAIDEGLAAVCRDDGYMTAASSAIVAELGRTSSDDVSPTTLERLFPALTFVHNERPPWGLSDARTALTLEAWADAGAPMSTRIYAQRRAAQGLLDRWIGAGREPSGRAARSAVRALLLADARLTVEAPGMVGQTLSDLRHVLSLGMLDQAPATQALSAVPFDALVNAELSDGDVAQARAVEDALCARAEPEARLACFRLSSALALRDDGRDACALAAALHGPLVRFWRAEVLRTIPETQWVTNVHQVAERGREVAARCPRGAQMALQTFTAASGNGYPPRYVEYDGNETVQQPRPASPGPTLPRTAMATVRR